jgi:hypothetical protein
MASQQPLKEYVQSIDSKTMKAIMEYFKFEDYDAFVGYVRKIGINQGT